MRNLLVVMALFCLTGCGQNNTKMACVECGATVDVNENKLCTKCAEYVSSSGSKNKRVRPGAGEVAKSGNPAHPEKHYVGWGRDFNAAQERAKKENKSMFVLFTGSDWCPPCQNLHKSVFTSSAFESQVPDDVVLVVCDNPRNASLVTAEERKQYKTLSAKYKVTGVPCMFLTDAEGTPYHKIVGYGGTPASEWVSDLMSKVKSAK